MPALVGILISTTFGANPIRKKVECFQFSIASQKQIIFVMLRTNKIVVYRASDIVPAIDSNKLEF